MNKVIILGGNHHNGLGLLRIFGLNGIKPFSFVVGPTRKSFLSKSKYCQSCDCFTNYIDALDAIIGKFGFEDDKAVLIPYSDGAAQIIDERFSDIQNKFLVQNINYKSKEITLLMNKMNQYNMCINNNILMAKTFIYEFDKCYDENINFPVIIKPVTSFDGDKKDITTAYNQDEFIDKINILKIKKYKKILIQELLNVDFEVDAFGCIYKNKDYTLIPTRTIRSWPKMGGTNSFSQITLDKEIVKFCELIVNTISNIGFYGFYDFEILSVDGKLYLNEINWRNSGDVYMGINQGIYYPYYWYLDAIGERKESIKYPFYETYAMTELSDFRNVLAKNVKIKQWLKDYKMTTDFAIKFKGDNKPYFNKIFNFFINKIRLKSRVKK